MKIKNLNDVKIFIGGIQGSGKTVCAKWLIKNKFKHALGIRLSADFDEMKNVTLVKPTGDLLEQLENMCATLNDWGRLYEDGKIKKNEIPYDCLVIDEADMIFRSNYDIKKQLTELIAMHRHYGIAIIFITRRLQDIPAKITESCRHRFFYPIEGKNVFKYLSNLHEDLEDMVRNLEYGKFDFVYHELGNKPVHMNKVKL